MYILKANLVSDKAYVAIEVVKQYHFTNAYFIEMDLSGNVLRWCKSGKVY